MRSSLFRGSDLGTLLTHKGLVKCGVRPVAEMGIRNENAVEARKLIEQREPPSREKVFYLEYPMGENHTRFYIFKHPHLRHIIEYMHEQGKEWDMDFCHWVDGHLFGYGEEEIGQHIERNRE